METARGSLFTICSEKVQAGVTTFSAECATIYKIANAK